MQRIGSGLDEINFGSGAPGAADWNALTNVPGIVTQLVAGHITDTLQLDTAIVNTALNVVANALLDNQGIELQGVSTLALGAPGATNDRALPSKNVWRITTDNGNNNFTGLAAPAAGQEERIIFIMNAGGTGTLTLNNQNAGSAAANRIIGPNGADLVIRPGGGAAVRYDTTSSRWRVLTTI